VAVAGRGYANQGIALSRSMEASPDESPILKARSTYKSRLDAIAAKDRKTLDSLTGFNGFVGRNSG